MDNRKIRCASFFAGVGGIDLGFEQAGFTVVYANELNHDAAATYEQNNSLRVDKRDIQSVSASEIPDFDIMLAGFPCQPFSIAGKREGFEDEKGRGELFFQLTRIIREKAEAGHQPRVCFFENVKNLVSHDNGNTFRVICEELRSLGYKVTWQVMNASKYGNIPQGRERIYIVAFLDEADFLRFRMPEPIPLTVTPTDVIDFDAVADERYYYTQGKYKGDIFDKLTAAIDDKNAVYQWRRRYVRKNRSGLIPTLTANAGTGGHNVPIIATADGRIRKMTPRECFSAQGFPKNFVLPVSMSDARLYKQAGNSVCVPVIRRIADAIADAIDCKA